MKDAYIKDFLAKQEKKVEEVDLLNLAVENRKKALAKAEADLIQAKGVTSTNLEKACDASIFKHLEGSEEYDKIDMRIELNCYYARCRNTRLHGDLALFLGAFNTDWGKFAHDREKATHGFKRLLVYAYHNDLSALNSFLENTKMTTKAIGRGLFYLCHDKCSLLALFDASEGNEYRTSLKMLE